MDLGAASRLARELLEEHNLLDWTLGFDRARRRAGSCRFSQKVITLSIPLTKIHPESEVRDTILHEIAHALVGPTHGHDEVWKATTTAIGATPERCYSDDLPQLPGRFTGTCPQGHQVERDKRPSRPSSCLTCTPTFDPEQLITWTMGDISIPMLPT
ncbi:SprT-like domain-containing protein [Kineosporia rhizophila]|nr:SprT-like domain-containing protein [Kineosporia rhizophila]MCE0540701.1 SprT-like domain-containing protein [Kineosporia rhizophila]